DALADALKAFDGLAVLVGHPLRGAGSGAGSGPGASAVDGNANRPIERGVPPTDTFNAVSLIVGGEIVGIRLARWQVPDASRVTASVIVEVLVTIVVQYAFAALGLVLLLATTDNMGGGTIGLALLLTLPLPVLGV
ncbi:hypothetical protein M3665_27840, partial [Bacillus licheniformis]|nr:hypothetical protein [Bacillus licheniformis]